jgi:hypothetical protein
MLKELLIELRGHPNRLYESFSLDSQQYDLPVIAVINRFFSAL